MNVFEKVPTRWLLAGAALACLALWVAPTSAQTSGDPVAGKLIFNDTLEQTNNQMLTGACTSCHDIGSRRARMGSGVYANITTQTAGERLNSALSNVPGMEQFDSVLGDTQRLDLAAYIADTPKTDVAQLAFTASAVNTNTLSQSVDLTNAATSGTLSITSATLSGSGAARFTLTADSCSTQTLAASASCRVSIRFSTPDTSSYAAALTVTMTLTESNTPVTFTRMVTLTGQVPPPPAPSSGGGALSGAWLVGLLLASALLRAQRRRV